jgi:hypothetical protein
MGKSKQSDPPSVPNPVNSEVWQDGTLTGKTTLNNGVQKQESYSTPYQLQQTAFNQSQVPTIQQRIFNPTQDMQDSWQSIAQANKNNTMKRFNEGFGKAQDSLIENLTSRGLANTSTANYLTNDLAKTAADQLNTIENQYTADQQNARANDYNYNSGLYNLLNGGIGDQLQVNQGNLSNATNGFNTGNATQQQNYQNVLQNWALNRELNPGGNWFTNWAKFAGNNFANVMGNAL